MFYDIHSYKMISNKRIYVKYFLFTGAKRIRKRYASVLNHLLYEFFLLRSTIITTTIAAIERIANNPIWAVSPVFTFFYYIHKFLIMIFFRIQMSYNHLNQFFNCVIIISNFIKYNGIKEYRTIVCIFLSIDQVVILIK